MFLKSSRTGQPRRASGEPRCSSAFRRRAHPVRLALQARDLLDHGQATAPASARRPSGTHPSSRPYPLSSSLRCSCWLMTTRIPPSRRGRGRALLESLSDGSDSQPESRSDRAARAKPCGSAHLDRGADERAVLGPRAVVVLDVRVPEQLLQREPRVRRTLPDPAVGDHLAVARDALGVVERLQLVGALEGAVVVGGLRPRDVRRAGDVARYLRLLLRKVVRGQLLTAELLRRPHVDDPTEPSLEITSSRIARISGRSSPRRDVLERGSSGRRPPARGSPAPTSCGRRSGAGPARTHGASGASTRRRRTSCCCRRVQHDRGRVADARRGEQLGEPVLVAVVAADGGVQVGVQFQPTAPRMCPFS